MPNKTDELLNSLDKTSKSYEKSSNSSLGIVLTLVGIIILILIFADLIVKL